MYEAFSVEYGERFAVQRHRRRSMRKLKNLNRYFFDVSTYGWHGELGLDPFVDLSTSFAESQDKYDTPTFIEQW
ncbi:uncharacterized protein MYCGRDRAFT_103372 [Zymoseptoria tritici IPO323]|uniref:Uncharacterized protein n=1 Tax=Zymoseptoria tritici (strain CBS 115943 / IPO323) TaxID=336722 RepID=F9X4L0_ZYMTI|nr:uncharacterized protein MYCGRDRAFT_103372 [Zymoseptoria tritici IPO323]EGP90063.1 hypothetical protein MYCGRDRAFT_103372 [Zymoseptoria tritici IPO323]